MVRGDAPLTDAACKVRLRPEATLHVCPASRAIAAAMDKSEVDAAVMLIPSAPSVNVLLAVALMVMRVALALVVSILMPEKARFDPMPELRLAVSALPHTAMSLEPGTEPPDQASLKFSAVVLLARSISAAGARLAQASNGMRWR